MHVGKQKKNGYGAWFCKWLCSFGFALALRAGYTDCILATCLASDVGIKNLHARTVPSGEPLVPAIFLLHSTYILNVRILLYDHTGLKWNNAVGGTDSMKSGTNRPTSYKQHYSLDAVAPLVHIARQPFYHAYSLRVWCDIFTY